MAKELILFQADELGSIKAKYSGLAEEMQAAGNNLKAAEARLNSCLSAMESAVGASGGGEYFYNSTWAGQQHGGMSSILSVLQKAADLTAETSTSLRNKINGAENGTVAGAVTKGGDTTVQTPTGSPGVSALTGALGASAGLSGLAAGSGFSAAAAAKSVTIGKNMERKTSIKTKNMNGKTVTVKGTYDVIKNVNKFTLDQRKYDYYVGKERIGTCTATSWAMTRNINDGKKTLNAMDKSNWSKTSYAKFPGSRSVSGSEQKLLSEAYKQLQKGKATTLYGTYKYSSKEPASPHAVTIIGVKPTANPKKLKQSDFLVIDPYGGSTRNMKDMNYKSFTRLYIDKT